MKQTEIDGVADTLIPDDWEVKNINKECTIKARIGWQGLKSNEYLDFGDYVLITGTDFDNGFINWKSCNYVSEWRFKQDKNIQIKQGDVLITKDGTIGKVAFLDEIPMKGTLNSGVFVIRPKSYEKIDTVFLSLIFKSIWFDSFLEQITSGSTIVHLYQKDFVTFNFPIPPTLAEQQRIAKALSDVDALISTTEKLIQKKKNIKQGAMQNLLTGKKRLPGFTKSSNYKQTEIGLIPEDWEVKSLGEIFEFRPNNTFTRDCLNDSKGKYQNVHYGDVLIKYPSILDCSKETIPFINEGINVKFSKYGIVEGDIIIADTAEDETVGKVVEVFNLGEKKIVSGLHTFLCRKITDDFAPKWLGYFMNQAIFHNQLLPFITGTKVSAISRTAIQNVKVLIPSKEEQTAIANVLSSMDKEIETLNTKLEKYINLKTAMMQQLLTGKIRLVK